MGWGFGSLGLWVFGSLGLWEGSEPRRHKGTEKKLGRQLREVHDAGTNDLAAIEIGKPAISDVSGERLRTGSLGRGRGDGRRHGGLRRSRLGNQGQRVRG